MSCSISIEQILWEEVKFFNSNLCWMEKSENNNPATQKQFQVASSQGARGMSLRKSLIWGLRVFCIFEKSGINKATCLAVTQLRGTTIAIISAHVPGLQWPSTCGRVLARARVQVSQNSGSQTVVFRFTTLSARECHWRNPRKKNYRDSNNIKRARVSALTGSVPHNMAVGQQSVSALYWNWGSRAFQHSTGIEPFSPDSLQLTLTT